MNSEQPDPPGTGTGPIKPGVRIATPRNNDNPPTVSFANTVNTLIHTDFADEGSGVFLECSGLVRIYLIADAPRLRAAIAALKEPPEHYTEIVVCRSLEEMLVVTHDLADRSRRLADMGIFLRRWAPSPPTGQVEVALSEPSADHVLVTSAALHELGITVSSTSYVEAVAEYFAHLYGEGVVSVSSRFESSGRRRSGRKG